MQEKELHVTSIVPVFDSNFSARRLEKMFSSLDNTDYYIQ